MGFHCSLHPFQVALSFGEGNLESAQGYQDHYVQNHKELDSDDQKLVNSWGRHPEPQWKHRCLIIMVLSLSPKLSQTKIKTREDKFQIDCFAKDSSRQIRGAACSVG